MRTYVRMVICVYLPRFELVLVAGGSQAWRGGRWQLAPSVGSEQRMGEVSGAAEACGVARGMMLGEALARCPDLVLVPPDPVRGGGGLGGCSRAPWSRSARPSSRPARVSSTSRPTGCEGSTARRPRRIAAARHALARPPRMGAGPTRFCALAAALAVRSRRPLLLEAAGARRWLAGRPVGLLGYREDTAVLLEPLDRLGVRTLGELAKLGRAALTDRFGAAGALAHRLACGRTPSCDPAAGRSASARRWRSATRAPARRWDACWACSSTACSHGLSDAGARCGPSSSPRACWRAAAGASGWSSVRRSAIPSASGWRSPRACCCCPRPPRGWR